MKCTGSDLMYTLLYAGSGLLDPHRFRLALQLSFLSHSPQRRTEERLSLSLLFDILRDQEHSQVTPDRPTLMFRSGINIYTGVM